MSATVSDRPDHVAVQIQGKLGYDIWTTLRDARNAAKAANVPLHFTMNACDEIDMAGIGALLVAQDRLPHVELSGCPRQFIKYFDAFGVCRKCDTHNPVAGCPKAVSASG
jgi:hypothetical protein